MSKSRLIALLLFAIVALALLFFAKLSDPIATGTISAARLEAGPYPVMVSELEISDNSRPTDANGDYAGSPVRQLAIKIWQPELDAGQFAAAASGLPLVVYSHGFSGTMDDPLYLAEFLASYGYILVSMDFPLTNLGAPGGPMVMDVINQPADISYVIDTLLGWNNDRHHPFYQRIDPERIGLVGHSLGGMTTVLASYHPRLRDQRVAAAVSLAGPMEMFGSQLFAPYDFPFLMVASDIDPMVEYHNNAGVVTDRVNNSVLVTLERSSHTGYTDQAKYLRFLDNPDSLGCWVVAKTVNEETPLDDMPLYRLLGSEQEGFLRVPPGRICLAKLEAAMSVRRQHDLTTLAVYAFLEAAFATTAEDRQQHSHYLLTTLAGEMSDVRVQKAASATEN